MKWGSPEIIVWLLLLIPAWWLVLTLERRKGNRLKQLVDSAIMPVLAPEYSARNTRRRTILWLIAFSIALSALARPQWGFYWEEARRRGLDIMIVLDTSRSMLAQDMKPNRLQQAKWGIRDLVRKLRGDRIGLVAFAGSSFLQCPLTMDYAAFLMTLDDVQFGTIAKGGSAIEQALRTAIAGFEERTDADRVIVLITDGEDHEGNPLTLLDDLKRNDIRIYTLGIGTLEGELLPPVNGTAGGFFKDRHGNVVKSALREDALQRLALETGGMYIRSTPGDIGIDRIYSQGIATLRRDEHESRMSRRHEERFAWFLGAALCLLILECALSRGSRATREESA